MGIGISNNSSIGKISGEIITRDPLFLSPDVPEGLNIFIGLLPGFGDAVSLAVPGPLLSEPPFLGEFLLPPLTPYLIWSPISSLFLYSKLYLTSSSSIILCCSSVSSMCLPLFFCTHIL